MKQRDRHEANAQAREAPILNPTRPSDALPPMKSPLPPPAPLRILITDDHAVVRDGLRYLIESQPGWHVVGEAATGREAVALAQKFKPQVVVMDYSMPGLNGLEATQRIRRALPDTEVLMLTIDDSAELVHQVIEAGARGFILKDDASSLLLEALRALAQHQSYFTPKITALVPPRYLKIP
jgi:two-component system, NarL family, response regulator NreC